MGLSAVCPSFACVCGCSSRKDAPEAELAEVGVLLHEGEPQHAQEEAPGGAEEDEGEEPPDGGDQELCMGL